MALALGAVGLLAALALLVLAKRLVRGRAERRSRGRRSRWVAALGTGPIPDMRMGELRALARQACRGAAAQEDLLSVLASGRLSPRDARREPFEHALRRAGLQSALRRACRSRRTVRRGRAALLWGLLRFPGDVLMLEPLLADPDADVRSAAIQALAACESEPATWALLRAMRDGVVAPERVVERLTGEWAVTPLLGALRAPAFAHVLPWVAEALGLTRDARVESALAALLYEGDEELRTRACRALGRLGLAHAAPVFVAALADESPSVRAQAARALGELRDEPAVSHLVLLMSDRSWWVRARAAEALVAIGPSGLAALRHCARANPDRFARERAVEALGLAVTEQAAAEEVAAA